MAAGRLKIDIRRQAILEKLNKDGQVFVTDLSAQLGATAVTIRNDLDALAAEVDWNGSKAAPSAGSRRQAKVLRFLFLRLYKANGRPLPKPYWNTFTTEIPYFLTPA